MTLGPLLTPCLVWIPRLEAGIKDQMEERPREAGGWSQPGEGTEETTGSPRGPLPQDRSPSRETGEAGHVRGRYTHTWWPRLPCSQHSPGQIQRSSCSRDPPPGSPFPPRSGVRGQRWEVRVPVPVTQPATPGTASTCGIHSLSFDHPCPRPLPAPPLCPWHSWGVNQEGLQ